MEELIHFDKELLLWINGSDSLVMDSVIVTLTTATTWIPMYLALFYVVLKSNSTVREILLVLAGAAACVLLAGTIDDTIVKPLVARWRPGHVLHSDIHVVAHATAAVDHFPCQLVTPQLLYAPLSGRPLSRRHHRRTHMGRSRRLLRL